MNAITRWASRGAALVLLSSITLLSFADPKGPPGPPGPDNAYTVTNLVSDGGVPAMHIDTQLVNAWGIAFNPNAFVWVADNGTGLSTLYDGDGVKNALVVSIPNGAPTGIVFNGSTTDFTVTNGTTTGVAAFIFATENGIIAGWSPGVDMTHAQIAVDNSATTGAIYKGIAIAGNGTARFVYAADFHNARIDVFDRTFQPVNMGANAFVDPHIPHGFAPFNIQNIGGDLYVAYAKQDADKHDEVAGPGQGFVDVYDANGSLVNRLIEHEKLNAPWGMTLAPASFGRFGGMLLVGNFGDGRINVFDPVTGKGQGTLETRHRMPIVIDGLWGLAFGNGLKDQPTNTLFFAAGPGDEGHGLYGRIDVSQ